MFGENDIDSILNPFTTFTSAENPDLWFNYLQGLESALERFGVEKIVLLTICKQASDSTYVILSRNPVGRVLGAIRLEVKSENSSLPIEKIENSSSRILLHKINTQAKNGKKLAEICGVWVSAEAQGQGLGADLIFEVTRLGVKLNVDILIGVAAAHTLDYCLKLGYVVDPDLPKIVYPDDRYLSTVVWYHVPVANKVLNTRDVEIS